MASKKLSGNMIKSCLQIYQGMLQQLQNINPAWRETNLNGVYYSLKATKNTFYGCAFFSLKSPLGLVLGD